MSACKYYGRKVAKTWGSGVESNSERLFSIQPTNLQPPTMRCSPSSLSCFPPVGLPSLLWQIGFPLASHPSLCDSAPLEMAFTQPASLPLHPSSCSLQLPNHRDQDPLTKYTTGTECVNSFTFQSVLENICAPPVCGAPTWLTAFLLIPRPRDV